MANIDDEAQPPVPSAVAAEGPAIVSELPDGRDLDLADGTDGMASLILLRRIGLPRAGMETLVSAFNSSI